MGEAESVLRGHADNAHRYVEEVEPKDRWRFVGAWRFHQEIGERTLPNLARCAVAGLLSDVRWASRSGSSERSQRTRRMGTRSG